MVWGCLAANGIGRLKVVSGMMNGTKYIDVLENKMLPSARSLFSDDDWIFKTIMLRATVLKKSNSGTGPIKLNEWIGQPNLLI